MPWPKRSLGRVDGAISSRIAIIDGPRPSQSDLPSARATVYTARDDRADGATRMRTGRVLGRACRTHAAVPRRRAESEARMRVAARTTMLGRHAGAYI
jgi:hypothetical protein